MQPLPHALNAGSSWSLPAAGARSTGGPVPRAPAEGKTPVVDPRVAARDGFAPRGFEFSRSRLRRIASACGLRPPPAADTAREGDRTRANAQRSVRALEAPPPQRRRTTRAPPKLPQPPSGPPGRGGEKADARFGFAKRASGAEPPPAPAEGGLSLNLMTPTPPTISESRRAAGIGAAGEGLAQLAAPIPAARHPERPTRDQNGT